jgi:integrase
MPKKASVEQKAEIRRAAAEWRAKHAWHPNQLRHTAATEIRRHAGLEAAQVILGHAKADVTQVYAERDQALAVETIKKIG